MFELLFESKSQLSLRKKKIEKNQNKKGIKLATMVNLIWYLTHVCEKEVCLSCAGLECVRLRESVVRTRALRAYRFLSVRVSAFAPYASLVSGLLQLSHGAKARG